MAARQPRTWWRRVLTLLAALVLFLFIWLERGAWAAGSRLGSELFDVLGGLGLVYALLGGPLMTVDCLARERREGTLGLLFLTDLHSYDVLAGKIFAAVFDMVLGIMVVLPVAAVPMLLGGVGFRDFAYAVIAVFNLLFLSIAVGTLGSAFFTSVRASLGSTVIFLASITFGPPVLFDGILNISVSQSIAEYLYMFCPLWTFHQSLSAAVMGRSTGYWLNMGGLHGLAWGCLLLAGLKTWRSWRESPERSHVQSWRRFVPRFSPLFGARRRTRRQRLLAANPVQWLESRDALQGKFLWAVFLATTAFWFYKHLRNPASWPQEETVVFWALIAHWIFCAWLAIQAPRRMADDKHSGALELLLCTTVKPRHIVRGAMRVLALRFGTVLAATMLLNTYAVFAYFVRRLNGTFPLSSLASNDIFELACCGVLVIPVQAYAFARVGLYQGLAQGNSLRATWHLVLKLGVLPWVLFFMALFSLEAYKRYVGLPWFGNDRYIFGLWAAAHLGVCGLFLASASLQLQMNFRGLAAQSAPLSLWSRLKNASKSLASKPPSG